MIDLKEWLKKNGFCDSIIVGFKLLDNLKDVEVLIDYYIGIEEPYKVLKLVCVDCFSLSYKLKDKSLVAPFSQFTIENVQITQKKDYIIVKFQKWDAIDNKAVSFFQLHCQKAYVDEI